MSPSRPVQSAASSRGTRKTAASAPPSRSAEAVDDARVEESADRELVGEDEPGAAAHRALRTPTRAAIRSASEAPSSPWNRSASSGVPHAGQPSTPRTESARPSSTRRSPSPSAADRGVVLEDEDVVEGRDLAGEPLGVEAVEPRQRDDAQDEAVALGEELGGEQRLVQQHRPVGDEDGVPPRRAAPTPRPDLGLVAARKLDPARGGPDREPERDVPVRVLDRPAQQRSGLLRVPRLHDRHAGERARGATRRAGSGGTSRARPGSGRRSGARRRPSCPRSPGCRSARSRATRGTTRTSSRRAGSRGARARRRSRPCPAPRSRTRRTDPGTRARRRARGSPTRGRRRGRRAARVVGRARREPLRTPRRRTRPSPSSRVPAPDSGSPSRLPAASSDATGSNVGGPRPSAENPARTRSSSSSKARSNGSSAGAPACQRYVPPPSASAKGCSMKDTPFPFTVSATSAFGLAGSPSRKPSNTSAQGGVVVAVAGRDLPAERRELRLQVAEREDLLRRLVRLQLVAVDDDPQVSEPLVRRGLQRLPVLPLLELAVAGHARRLGRRDRAGASPTRSRVPFEIPMPSEPEFASIPGTPTSGWPSRPPSRRRRRRRSRGTTPRP